MSLQAIILVVIVLAFASSIGAHYTGACKGMPDGAGSIELAPALILMDVLALPGAVFVSHRVESTVGLHIIDARKVMMVAALVIIIAAFLLIPWSLEGRDGPIGHDVDCVPYEIHRGVRGRLQEANPRNMNSVRRWLSSCLLGGRPCLRHYSSVKESVDQRGINEYRMCISCHPRFFACHTSSQAPVRTLCMNIRRIAEAVASLKSRLHEKEIVIEQVTK